MNGYLFGTPGDAGDRSVPGLSRLVGVWFAVATAFLGGALGVLPDVIAGDPAKPDFWPRVWAFVVVLFAGLGALYGGWRTWRRRDDMLARRGTAYVVQELAEGWTEEKRVRFENDVREEFAHVLQVPGPSRLGEDWNWPLGDGAERWDENVDLLVRSFASVNANDAVDTDNALFVWAPWPVAWAWSARVCAARRDIAFAVRQRPSRGRGGVLEIQGWKQPPHSFLSKTAEPMGHALPPEHVRLTVTSESDALDHPETAGATRILLVRMVDATWGSHGLDTNRKGSPSLPEVEVHDGARLGLPRASNVELREWRCLPSGPFHPWKDYPSLASSATDWVADNALSGGCTLLGLVVPQEVSVGMGVMVGKRSQETWAEHIWPLVFGPVNGAQTLAIPRLDLGWLSLHPGQ